ncbi:hypothetical protein RhiirA5_416020 [Rhizophagus irregularis]|uniref:Uncharacterized protein n=1 Tax=Rhizophagus irregularis TaxID=588596 RepID=A0A2N0PQP9_9GLOM|nr:hypothetical protein RhiirA5_416020 [Rhizophagus irregularis]
MEHLIHRTQSLCVCSRHLRKSKHISEIRSLIRQSQNISDVTFKRKIKSIFKINELLKLINLIGEDGLDIKKCPSHITTSLSGDEKVKWKDLNDWINDAKLDKKIVLNTVLIGQDSVEFHDSYDTSDKDKPYYSIRQFKNGLKQSFSNELLNAINSISNDELGNSLNLEKGIIEVFEYFTKWISQWVHLPSIATLYKFILKIIMKF